MSRVPTLPPETIESPGFLDALRDQLQAWSLGRHEPDSGGFRSEPDVEPSVMGATDVVWLRYASNEADMGAPDRNALTRFIQRCQDPGTGRVAHRSWDGHGGGHAFWQTVRALRILGADLLHFPEHLRPMCTPEGLDEWFAGFNWDTHACERPGHHHEVLGLVPVAVSIENDELVEVLFRNLARQQSTETGTWPRSHTNISRTFAYTALHLATGRLPGMPEKIVDALLASQHADGFWDVRLPHFHTMDAAYVLIRLPPLIGGYRKEDAIAAMRRLSKSMRETYAEEQETFLRNTHHMLAATHTFGLLQEAFPEAYPSTRPYRFDWDRLALYASETIRGGYSNGGRRGRGKAEA